MIGAGSRLRIREIARNLSSRFYISVTRSCCVQGIRSIRDSPLWRRALWLSPSPTASFLSEQYSAERADAAVPRLRRPLPRTAQEPLEAVLAQHLRHLHEGPADAALRQDAARHYRPCAGLGMVRRGERRQARRGQPRLRDTARSGASLTSTSPKPAPTSPRTRDGPSRGFSIAAGANTPGRSRPYAC